MTNSEARKRAQAAASQVQGAAEVGADVEALKSLIYRAFYGPAPLPLAWGPMDDARFNTARDAAEAIMAAGWVPGERVAEARAEAEATIARVRGLLTRWQDGAESWGTCSHEWMSLAALQDALDGDQGGGLLDEDGGA